MFDHGEYSYSSTAAEADDPFSCMNSSSSPFSTTTQSSRKKKSKNKRRFSDEQIKSLESMFENETRLEPRKKLQLASELGLQPRQVAIWFQNKRARWKSKQLEREYSILLANYNNLAFKFEALKKEKQGLVVQLQELNNDLIQRPKEESQCFDRESDNEQRTKSESEAKPSLSIEKSEHVLGVLSDDDSSMKAEYFGLENDPDNNLLNIVEPAEGSLTSTEEWENLNSDSLFNESSGGYEWWDFWA
ncbi:hypothetical protein UlMin_021774 [Ulmus minor]